MFADGRQQREEAQALRWLAVDFVVVAAAAAAWQQPMLDFQPAELQEQLGYELVLVEAWPQPASSALLGSVKAAVVAEADCSYLGVVQHRAGLLGLAAAAAADSGPLEGQMAHLEG